MGKLNKWISDNPVLGVALVAVVAISLASRTPIFGWIDRVVAGVAGPINSVIGGFTSGFSGGVAPRGNGGGDLLA